MRHKFSKEINREFANTLKTRVNAYFQDNDIHKYANNAMVVKSIIMLLIYLTPFVIMLSGLVAQPVLLFALWGIMGLGKAGIGTGIMHDALHGVYSKNKSVNRLMGFSLRIIGGEPVLWKIQHNVLHHSFTNIEHADEDIASRYVMRFTPYQPRKWFHRFQHIYAFFFYGLLTLVWLLVKDFNKYRNYKSEGLIKSNKKSRNILFHIILTKASYVAVFLGLPILLLPVAPGMVILMFLTMHFVAGLFLSIVFQTAHVMPSSEFIEQEEQQIAQNWAVHQLLTTTNYAPNNTWLNWFIGGLNYQVEHHLFPNICHIHYRNIAEIVKDTTKEYNLPYYSHKSFRSAIWSHIQMLKTLGKYDVVPAQA